jgi:hypothetical protein
MSENNEKIGKNIEANAYSRVETLELLKNQLPENLNEKNISIAHFSAFKMGVEEYFDKVEKIDKRLHAFGIKDYYDTVIEGKA